VDWVKPSKPKWMSQEAYDALPATIKIREFRVNGKVYVTTILDHKQYHKKDLVDLYGMRWQVEINLCSIKSVLEMDQLSCKTPDMVKKEIAAYMMGYNVIRIIMAEACCQTNSLPNKISFKGSLQLLNQFMPRILAVKKSEIKDVYERLLSLIALNKIGSRPGRVEPRAVKRRKKPFPALNAPREKEREKILRKRKYIRS